MTGREFMMRSIHDWTVERRFIGPLEAPAFHGQVRAADNKVFDATCAYGGGWLTRDVFALRERERSLKERT